MRFVANSQPGEGVTRERLLEYFADHDIKTTTWDLVRHRVVTEYAFKVGARPGLVVFLDVDSEEDAAEVVNSFPIVAEGLLVFDIDPVSAVAKF